MSKIWEIQFVRIRNTHNVLENPAAEATKILPMSGGCNLGYLLWLIKNSPHRLEKERNKKLTKTYSTKRKMKRLTN